MCLCLYEKKEKIRESERCGKPRERKIYFVRFVWLGIKGVGGGSRPPPKKRKKKDFFLLVIFFLFKELCLHLPKI